MSHVMAITNEGGEMIFDSLGIRTVVPSNAVPPGRTQLIKISLITQLSDYITMRDDEVLGTSGIQCLPDGLQLHCPLKIIIPHCTPLSACDEVRPVLYSGNEPMGNILTIQVLEMKTISSKFKSPNR